MDWQQGQESSNLEDRRRMSGGKMAIGGGIGTIIVLIVGAFLGVDPQLLDQFLGNLPQGAQNQVEQRPATPEEEHYRQFASKILRFTEEVWGEQFEKAGKRYIPPHMVLFSHQVNTGCGTAPSAVGPFYCPADKTVYLDPTFFDELDRKLGGSKAEFSQAYVIAHEVGHHIQHLLDYGKIVDEKRRTESKAIYNQYSVRLELQADYLAGVWAYYGQKKYHFIESGDVESAIKSANAIGDDRLQKRSTGFVSPESFTHGTSAQRVRWFRRGLETGDMSMLRKIFDMPYSEL